MKKTPLFFKYWHDIWKNNKLLISCIYFLTLKNILFNDVMQVFSSLIMYSMRIISNFLMLTVFFIITTIISPVLGLCLLVMSIFGFYISILLRKKIKLYSTIVNAELKNTNAVTNSFIDLIELFKTNNLDSYIKYKHFSAMKNFITAVRKSDFIQVFLKNILSNVNTMFNLLTLCLVLIIEKKYFIRYSFIFIFCF